MIDKSRCKKIRGLLIEYADLQNRIKNYSNQKISDIVTGSDNNYPYAKHTYKIEGIPTNGAYKKYSKMLKKRAYTIGKELAKFEYELSQIGDGEIITILRLKYIDGLTNNQIAHKLNNNKKKYKFLSSKDYTSDSIRVQLQRFFKKN